jgi:hypothetical protein
MVGQSTIQLPLLAFNDVYRVSQKYNAPTPPAREPGSSSQQSQPEHSDRITVAQFARLLLDIRDKWRNRDSPQYDDDMDGVMNRNDEEGLDREGLVLFAGDGESCRQSLSLNLKYTDDPLVDHLPPLLFHGIPVFSPSVESSVTRGSDLLFLSS